MSKTLAEIVHRYNRIHLILSRPSDYIEDFQRNKMEYHKENFEVTSLITAPGVDNSLLCDMAVIEPYKRALSIGGHEPDGALIVILSACFLPQRSVPNYNYIMRNMFIYITETLGLVVKKKYVLVYLHEDSSSSRVPSLASLLQFYRQLDYPMLNLKLKYLYLVHPNTLLKSYISFMRHFLRSNIVEKVIYIQNLKELSKMVPMNPNAIPVAVKQNDRKFC